MALGFGRLKREVVRGQGQGLLKTFFLSFADVDWARTKAYSLGNVGQIYVNVAGREPQGSVQPGAEYERVREEIISRLRELRDPETHEAVVQEIYRREEIYSGEYVELAPDIVFLPARLEYFGFGEYEFGSHKIIEAMKRGISGTHRMQGVFIAYGAGIEPGVELQGAALVDLAPTIMHLLGLPVPSHMDGRVLDEMLSPLFSPAPYTGRVDTGYDGNVVGVGLTEEQQRVVAERLRGLGYVG
jgi:predicted AlkP superfamily phosphohydrolase/phosphomutase